MAWNLPYFTLFLPILALLNEPIGDGPFAAPQLPAGIASADWADIRRAHDAARHGIVATPHGYEAPNAAQRWSTQFDGEGFTVTPDHGEWTWGLHLNGCGTPGKEIATVGTASISTAGERLLYSWNSQVTEWFENDSRGLEHGFTILAPPHPTTTQLSLQFSVRGSLTSRVERNGRTVHFIDETGATVVLYGGLLAFDADGTSLPASFTRTSNGLQLIVDTREARYPISIDPVAQQAYLKATNTEPFDGFGASIAAFADTVVVGAVGEASAATGINGSQSDNSKASAGAVYVFVRNGSTWSQQAYLKASNTDAGDEFGRSLSISGDTLVVGAAGEDSVASGVNGDQSNNSAFDSGAAYVFVRNGTTWTQQAYLKASNSGSGDIFGAAVSISGDTIIVGAPQESSNATGVNGSQSNDIVSSAGAAYVFIRNGTTWSQQAYLKASNTESQADLFGSAVSVSENTVVVGAPFEDSNGVGVNGAQNNNSAADSGAVYVFFRTGATWSQQAYLKASNTGTNDQFGDALCISGNTVIVGARMEDSNAVGVNGSGTDPGPTFNSGAAYVFSRTGSTWTQQAYLKASNTGAGDQFGNSVSVSGNAVAVGAWQEASNAVGINGNQSNNGAFFAGAVYVFARSASTWAQQAYLKASNTEAADQFGYSVSVSGDLVAASARFEGSAATGVDGDPSDNSAPASGAAYMFDLDNNPGAFPFGTGTAGCSGIHLLDVNHAPLLNSPHFGLTCSAAPPSTLGLGILGNVADLSGSDPFAIGALLHVNLLLSTELYTLDFVSDATGASFASAPIPNSPTLAGSTFYAMALWVWSTCSLPPYNISTSRGLQLELFIH